MEGVIITRENIKPSFPTPLSHKTLKLSLLDQIIPPLYAPVVLYYPKSNLMNTTSLHHHHHPQFIDQTTLNLKQSLASTLTRFYPLAGAITTDRLTIDCNDQGIPFLVAKFSTSLSDFLRKPNPIACRAHIPSPLNWVEPTAGDHVAMIQINFFECGGIAIGALFFHKVVDGATIATFVRAWAAEAAANKVVSETSIVVSPCFGSPALFPANPSLTRDSSVFTVMRQYFQTGSRVVRRYVFYSSALSKLREHIMGEEGIKPSPTRVEMVSALMWHYFMEASAAVHKSRNGVENNQQQPQPPPHSLVSHGVNVRRKTQPKLPDHSFGNLVWLVGASTPNTQHNREVKHLLNKVRGAIRKVDGEFVKRMQGKDGLEGYHKNVEETWSEFHEGADYLVMTSWCNMGFYDIDFGWGKPVWISRCDAGTEEAEDAQPFLNVLWLMDTPGGDGIEAWVTLKPHYFAEFDKIQGIRDLATFVDPSPWDVVARVNNST